MKSLIFRAIWHFVPLVCAVVVCVVLCSAARAGPFDAADPGLGDSTDPSLPDDTVTIYHFDEPFTLGMAFHNALTIGAFWNSRAATPPIDWNVSGLLSSNEQDLTAGQSGDLTAMPSGDQSGVDIPEDDVMSADSLAPIEVAPADSGASPGALNFGDFLGSGAVAAMRIPAVAYLGLMVLTMAMAMAGYAVLSR